MNLNDETMNVVKSTEMNLTDTSFHFEFQITGFLLAYIRSSEFLLSWHSFKFYEYAIVSVKTHFSEIWTWIFLF